MPRIPGLIAAVRQLPRAPALLGKELIPDQECVNDLPRSEAQLAYIAKRTEAKHLRLQAKLLGERDKVRAKRGKVNRQAAELQRKIDALEEKLSNL